MSGSRKVAALIAMDPLRRVIHRARGPARHLDQATPGLTGRIAAR